MRVRGGFSCANLSILSDISGSATRLAPQRLTCGDPIDRDHVARRATGRITLQQITALRSRYTLASCVKCYWIPLAITWCRLRDTRIGRVMGFFGSIKRAEANAKTSIMAVVRNG
jgi:hypothetical protein